MHGAFAGISELIGKANNPILKNNCSEGYKNSFCCGYWQHLWNSKGVHRGQIASQYIGNTPSEILIIFFCDSVISAKVIVLKKIIVTTARSSIRVKALCFIS